MLRDFRFIPAMDFNNNAPQPGMLILTQKMEGKNNLYVLTFESSLIVQWPRSATLAGKREYPHPVARRKRYTVGIFSC